MEGNDSGGDVVDAYLSTSVGSSTTSAYATQAVITVPDYTNGFSSVTLFTGLSLAVDTSYYLTLAPEDGNSLTWGIDNNQPSPVADTGVVLIPATFCSDDIYGCGTFPPGSASFDPNSPASFPIGVNPIFSVTAQGSSTPEPGTALLFGAGLGLLAIGHRSRRRG